MGRPPGWTPPAFDPGRALRPEEAVGPTRTDAWALVQAARARAEEAEGEALAAEVDAAFAGGLDGPPGAAPPEADGIDPAALAAAANLGGGGDPAALAAIAGQLRGTGVPAALLEAARGTAGVGEAYYRALEALEGDDLSDMEEFGGVVGDG